MTVYITLFDTDCILMADTNEELFAIGRRIPLSCAWYWPGDVPYFNFSSMLYTTAIQLGAVDVPQDEYHALHDHLHRAERQKVPCHPAPVFRPDSVVRGGA